MLAAQLAHRARSKWQYNGLHLTIAGRTAAQTAQFLTLDQRHRLYAAFHLIALR